MMYCDKCNAEFPDGMTYCKWCGGSLRAKAVATTQLRKCYACASPIQSRWEFCNVCGARQTPITQEPISISPLCMRCGAVVPPGVSNCLRCGERFTAERRPSPPPGNVPAPSTVVARCAACGDALEKGAIYCKTCGNPVAGGTIGFQSPVAPPPPQPRQPTPPQGSPNPDATMDFSALRQPPQAQPPQPPIPPPPVSHPDDAATMDFSAMRPAPPASQPPQPPPPDYAKTENIQSPPAPDYDATVPFTSGRSPDESSGQQPFASKEPPKSSSLETRVERPSLQNMTPPPNLPTMPVWDAPATSLKDSQPSSDAATTDLRETSAPPFTPPPAPPAPPNAPPDISTIQIGSGDWLAGGFASDHPPDAPVNQPPAMETVFDNNPDTIINRSDKQTPAHTAEWQQSPTVEAPRYEPPVTQTHSGETATPFQRSATPPSGQSVPPQPMPPPLFPTTTETQKRGGLPIIPIAAAIVGLGIVAFLVYWFALRAKPTTPNANVTNANTSVANSNTTVANSNTSTPTPTVPEGMVMIAAGSYTIGNDNDDIARPKRTVGLKAFYIDKTEVTNADYKKFVLATSRPAPSDWENGSFPAGKDRFPVVNITWKDATDYAVWANKRLPTEEEWEAAARGTDGKKYPWGNNWVQANANIKSTSVTEVGKYPNGKSPAGALDMIGNVWEWTASKFALYPGNSGTAPDEASRNYRVIRGGAYDGDQRHDGSYRGYVEADKAFPRTGFRCVKDAQ